MTNPHECHWVTRLRWSHWRHQGSLMIREARKRTFCSVCNTPKPVRRRPPYTHAQFEAATASPPPHPDKIGRRVAAHLLRSATPTVPAMASSLSDEWHDRFMRAGWLRLTYRTTRGQSRCGTTEILDRDALDEYAHPGERAAREEALAEALVSLEHNDHPVAVRVAERLRSGEITDPTLIRALAAVAGHAGRGDVLASRVFSARYLGDSKALARLQRRMEKIVGPLDALDIREGGSHALIGGSGSLTIGSTTLDLTALGPFIGLTVEALDSLVDLHLPPGGLFVVENLAPFEACCRGEIPTDSMVLWSAGYPGRAVLSLVQAASTRGLPVRTWADLDLDGVRIARIVASHAGDNHDFYRMSAQDVRGAPARIPLKSRNIAAIAADLQAHPDAPLTDVLQALLATEHWVEQEVFLTPPPNR